MNTVCLALNICALAVMLIACYFVYFRTNGKKTKDIILKIILGIVTFGTTVDILTTIYVENGAGGSILTFTIFMAYIPIQIWFALISLYRHYYLKEKSIKTGKEHLIMAGISLALVIFIIVAYFGGFLFSFDAQGDFMPLQGAYIVGAFDLLLMLWYLLGCIYFRKMIGKYDALVLFMFVFIPMVAHCLEQAFSDLFCINFAMSVSVLFCFMTEQFNSLQKHVEKIKGQNEKLKALANIYLTMHIINLSKDTYEEYNSTDAVRHFADKQTGARETMRVAIQNTIAPAYLEKALSFTNLDTIGERLKDVNTVSEEFFSLYNGWVRGRFVVIDRDENNLPINIIWATVVIQSEKDKEQGLIQISHTDELTQLGNRRAYEEALRELDEEKDVDITIISMDVNGLKKVNDTMGHAAGDELIKGAAQCMLQAFGGYGNIYRTGGDEFVALLNITGEDISAILANFDVYLKNRTGTRVNSISVSYGFVNRSEYRDKTMEQIISLADRGMYEMKKKYYEAEGIDRRKRF